MEHGVLMGAEWCKTLRETTECVATFGTCVFRSKTRSILA